MSESFIDSPEMVKQRAKQLDINCRWLMNQIDQIHEVLCPGKIGTWQDRATNSVEAAKKIVKERSVKDRKFNDVVRDMWVKGRR